METMTFDESYGTMPTRTRACIRRHNVSPSDWDMMLSRWGYKWDEPNLPWREIENHIETHSRYGSYSYPLYG